MWSIPILLALACVAASPAIADTEDLVDADADSAAAEDIRNLLDLGLSGRDSWYVRGFDKLFARDDTAGDDAARGDPVRLDAAFLPYTDLRIRRIWILGREAFGTMVADTAAGADATPEEIAENQAGSFTRTLNALTTATRPSVIGNYLLFDEGDLINPFALGDSERLLRQQPYISDAKIEVLPLEDEPGWADIFVLVRDRFPLGAKAKIHTRDRYNLEVFHRNIAGIGLNLEYEVPVERGKEPAVGHRTRVSYGNLAGSFVDLSVQYRTDWAREELSSFVIRDFVHLDIKFVGGLGYFRTVDKNHPLLPPGFDLETRTVDPWLGWAFRLSDADEYGRRRTRLIPAIRIRHSDYVAPPRQYAEHDRQWFDSTFYLGQVTVLGVDYYTASLVNGYGETEDIPSGMWAGLVGGYETGEIGSRYYHGISAYWPVFTERKSMRLITAGFGGFRRNGHFEDGVLDLSFGGFGPLQRRRYGAWRQFWALNYTLGINRTGLGGLRLDEFALRDLDTDQVVGDQRLSAEYEAVLFTRLAILGFQIATFGYASGGLVGDAETTVLDERFAFNLGVGLRLNNPRLVIPTTELRMGFLSTPVGTDFAVTVRMGDLGLLRRDVPSVVPETIGYR